MSKKEIWKKIYELDSYEDLKWIKKKIEEELIQAGELEKKYTFFQIEKGINKLYEYLKKEVEE